MAITPHTSSEIYWEPEPEEMDDDTWDQLCGMTDPDNEDWDWDEVDVQEMLCKAASEITRLRNIVDQHMDTIEHLGTEHDVQTVAIQMLREALEPFVKAGLGTKELGELVKDPAKAARKTTSNQGSFSH